VGIVTDFSSAHNHRECPVPLLSRDCPIGYFSKIVIVHEFSPAWLANLCRLHEIAILLAISGSGGYQRAIKDPDQLDTKKDKEGSLRGDYHVGRGVWCVLSLMQCAELPGRSQKVMSLKRHWLLHS
jgi:hypothetical protein